MVFDTSSAILIWLTLGALIISIIFSLIFGVFKTLSIFKLKLNPEEKGNKDFENIDLGTNKNDSKSPGIESINIYSSLNRQLKVPTNKELSQIQLSKIIPLLNPWRLGTLAVLIMGGFIFTMQSTNYIQTNSNRENTDQFETGIYATRK